jgi:hypothetical protein
MARQKGSQKYGGRKAGTPNRTTEQIRQLIQLFIEDNLPDIQNVYKDLEPKDKARFIDSMLKHIVPPPATPEKLSEDQLKQLYDYFITKYQK